MNGSRPFRSRYIRDNGFSGSKCGKVLLELCQHSMLFDADRRDRNRIFVQLDAIVAASRTQSMRNIFGSLIRKSLMPV